MAAAQPTIKSQRYYGTPQTIRAMFEAAHGDHGSKSWRIRERVEDVIKHIRPRDYWSECLAIYYWTCSPKFRYTRDPLRTELVKTPTMLLSEIDRRGVALGDCDDLATFIMACVGSIGSEGRFMTVGFVPTNGRKADPRVLGDPIFRLITSPHPRLPGPFSHVFCQAQKPMRGAWVSLDPVAGPRIGEMHRRAKQVRIYQES